MRQTEASFQKKLIKQYEADGWYEVKAADGRLSSIQTYRHAELQMLGFTVETIKP